MEKKQPIVTNLAPLERGLKPRIVAVVDSLVPIADLNGLKRKGIDLLEIRVDLIDTALGSLVGYLRDIEAQVRLPLIGTVRESAKTAPLRPLIFRTIMPLIQGVDIELGCAIMAEVIREAHGLGKTVIVSEHDFEKTPDEAALQSIVDRAMAGGADIVKIATMARTEDDAVRLLKFTKACPVPIAAFAMGERGAFSRVIAGEYGSLFTYGYISTAVAPGQLSAVELVKKIKEVP
jgi:3-dehydroquinate dehydratase-1